MMWAIVGGFAVLLVGLVAFLFRSNGSGGRTRVAADGFFVRERRPGDRVRWRARVNGTWRSGTADIAGEETFVYTGGTPTEIEIEDADAAFVAPSAPVSSAAPPSSNDDDSGFTGFPSAY